ncbi:MAG: biopolymer transporter ExbD [Planctomycetes bacterium]|nr:biopolymer transporter ExbD [Planctomycetota bacterium]
MKVRHQKTKEDIRLEMTPMIDIVFQLLIFFIMTFKVVSAEGDFNIKMPLAAPREGQIDDQLIPPIKVRMTANSAGVLTGVSMNQRSLDSQRPFQHLHEEILGLVGTDSPAGGDGAEVELDCDYNLKYEYVIEAITAVSGYRDNAGNIVKLVEKIKFAPPKNPPS